MIFIYNNTDAKIGMKTEVNKDKASIDLLIDDNAKQLEVDSILTTTNKDVIDTLSKWGDSYSVIHRNPFKTNIEVPSKQRTVFDGNDEIKVFSLSDEDDENKKYPRVILFVISGRDAEVYTDSRNVYKENESIVVGDYKLTKILIKWGRWSSLKIRTFITIKDGDVSKKIQLLGIKETYTSPEGEEKTYTTNGLDISDMTDEEYEIIKEGKIPNFGKESLIVRDTTKKHNQNKNFKNKKFGTGKKEYPNKKRANHGHGKDNRFNGNRDKSFKGNKTYKK